MQYNKNEFFGRVLAEYKAKNAQAQAKGQPQPGVPILTESSLRLETYITATTTTYTFAVLAGQNSTGNNRVLPTETRLEQNDNFHIGQTGFYIAVTTEEDSSDFRLKTYPNEIDLAGAAPALNYGTIYNGEMKINVNQVDVVTHHRLSKHLYIPQTQKLSGAVNTNFDEVNMLENGLVSMAPSIMLSGAYTNIISITLPAAITAALTENRSRLVLIFDGLRAQNAAVRKGSL